MLSTDVPPHMYPEDPLPYLQQLDNGLYLEGPLPSTLTKMQMILAILILSFHMRLVTQRYLFFSFFECIFVFFSNSHMEPP